MENVLRVAALYDIHGNLPALEAVLVDVRSARVDRIIVGGDVLPGPMPSQALDALHGLDIPVDYIYGNGERAVLASIAGEELSSLPQSVRQVIRWTADQLSAEQRRLVAAWPATARIEIAGLGDVLFCHATPRDDNEIFTQNTSPEIMAPVLEPAAARTIVCGHTHMQFDQPFGEVRVVNAGSIGMPFGQAGAYWALLGPGIELKRTEYDREAAAQGVLASDYPDPETFVRNVLDPPSEADMLQVFEGATLTS